MSTKKDKFTSQDKMFMDIALKLAETRHGLTGPNPSVGCVIVKNNNIISVGRTSINGRPHAEFNAIKDCTENLEDSKMYVTLEPCCHYGLTPPCTKLIIKSKISEVIYSVSDVDSRVRNKSYNILKKNNLKVRKGLLKEKIERFYIPYFFNKKNKLPFITGKLALSKNNIIYSKQNSKITNAQSDKFTHLLRYHNDSLMISYKTLNKDNPKLNCRLKNFKSYSPTRVILDNKLDSKLSSYIIKTSKKNKTIIFYNQAVKSKIQEFKKKKIKLIKSRIKKNNKFDIIRILRKLYNLGYRNLLIEGGDKLTNYFLNYKIFNHFYLYKSSKNLSKKSEFLEFSGLDILKKNYKRKINLNYNLNKDKISLYKN